MLSRQTLFTGVVEGQDIKSTLDLALKLHPATKNIYVINDNTMTGNSIEKTLQETIPQFKDRVNFISLKEYDMTEIKEKVSRLPPDSLVLFLIFFRMWPAINFPMRKALHKFPQIAPFQFMVYGILLWVMDL